MKIALLTTDSREHFREYESEIPYFGAAPEALLQGFAELPEHEVHVLSCLKERVPSVAKIYPNIWYHGAYVPKLGWMRSLYVGCILADRRKLRSIRPDVVHGQGTERDCALGAVFSGLPNVLTIHGNMAELARLFRARFGSFGWAAARLENLAMPRTDGVLCNSEYTENLVRPRARKTWLVPNPIRREFFSEPAPKASLTTCPVLINVGVISPRKQQVEILRIARRLFESGLRAEVHFAGEWSRDSPYGQTFGAELAHGESHGYARYVGKQNVFELIQRFDQASAIIHFPFEEAFGLVVAEGLARNLKLFASNVGGIREIASGVEDAELFRPDDGEGLYHCLERWLKSGCPASRTAAALMRARYHPRIIAEQHVEIYREVMGRKPKG